MDNKITPTKELEKWFADLICNITGINEKNSLLQYPIDGQISSKIDEDYSYVKVTPETDERAITKSRKKTFNPETEQYEIQQYSQRTITTHVIFYGPNSVYNATLFYDRLFHPDIKYELDVRGLSLVPDRTNGPTRLPEAYNGRWWERCDIELRFYESVVTVSTVESFAELDIRTEVDK